MRLIYRRLYNPEKQMHRQQDQRIKPVAGTIVLTLECALQWLAKSTTIITIQRFVKKNILFYDKFLYFLAFSMILKIFTL